MHARFVVWDDPSVDWSSFALCLIRSPWDYTAKHREFVAWAEAAARLSSLYNPLQIVRWNIHKSYLLDLVRADVPVVPSAIIPAGSTVSVATLARERGWTDVVLKPAVNAGGFRTVRVRASTDAAEAYMRETSMHDDVLVQPFVPSIQTDGETSIVLFDGQPSHTVRKRPAGGEFRIQERFGGAMEACEPQEDELRVAHAALAAAGAPLPYARVDLARIDGAPHVMELEVIEPALYFQFAEQGPARLADAIVRRLSDAPKTEADAVDVTASSRA